jgi:dihydropteroate synthase
MNSNNVKIMGILNITPDSFHDGDINILDETTFLDRINSVKNADIIDIGAESSRPGADVLDSGEEIKRISAILPFIDTNSHTYSIDTYKSATAEFALSSGFSIVNDISGGTYSDDMFSVIKDFNADIVIMHMQGNPQTMQKNPQYNDVMDDIYSFLERQSNCAIQQGVSKEKIILDPGIGFGKSIRDNDIIIKKLSRFKSLECRILIGLSRKSFLMHDNDTSSERLENTIALNTLSILNGADIIRVHDVESHIKVCTILDRLKNTSEKFEYGPELI